MKKLTKRAASLLVAAAMCVPAVTSAAAAEGVDYDDYYCTKVELNDLEIPAYGNGEYTFKDYGFVYQYDEDTILSMISGSATWEPYLGEKELTETFDNFAAYTAQHDSYVGFSGSPCYQKDGIDAEVWCSGLPLITDNLHITLKPTQPLVTDLTVKDCEIVKGSYELKPEFSFTVADGTTYRNEDSIFNVDVDRDLYRNPLEFDFGGKDLSELEIGTYTVTARVLDAETTFRLTVKEQPDIADITFENLTFDELLDKKTDPCMSEIRFVDGTSVKPIIPLRFDWQSIKGFDYSPSKMATSLYLDITVDDDPWTIGAHPLTIRHGSFCKTYTYRVEPSVVKSIVADDLVLSEADGSLDYAGESRETLVFYNRFQDYRPRITITLQDGTTQVIPEEHVGYYRIIDDAVFQWISIEDDQSAENPWTVGEHTATAYLSTERSEESVEVPFKVIVTESPVASVAAEDITVGFENLIDGDWGSVYEIKPDLTVQMADGTTTTLPYEESYTWQERDYKATLSNTIYTDRYPSPDHLDEGIYGTHIVYAHFMGKIAPVKVTVTTLQTICLDSVTDSGDSLTIAYTAQKTDDTVCTGNVSFDKNGDSTRIYDNNLGWVLLLHDASNGEYSLRIGAHRIPLTTGETFRLYSELGDADGNGSVDIQDATFIQKGLAKFDDVSLNRNTYDERFYAADVNRNGKIDICDVTALQRMIAL